MCIVLNAIILNSFLKTDEIDHEEAFFSASDPLLMEQFLDSLGHTMTIPSSSNNSDGDSFFTPASQSNISDQQMVELFDHIHIIYILC